MSDFKIRPATRQDLTTLADILTEGFSTYRRWSPIGWEPPTRAAMLLGLMHKFGQDGSWGLMAFRDGDAAGQSTARPERTADGEPRSDLARLTQLFVLEKYWGSGLAGELHELTLEGMRERGFEQACLWAAVGQARARAFYEREGWTATGRLDSENELGLELMEYGRTLLHK
ncbi:MAG: GNAT family N-acetyltransferase [Solirubrobacteraceae bacterium]